MNVNSRTIWITKIMLLIFWCDPWSSVEGQQRPKSVCLTGVMTDVQSWVDENGQLTTYVDIRFAVDLSNNPSPSSALLQGMFRSERGEGGEFIKYLSMARCRLSRVPSVFETYIDRYGRNLSQTLEYLSLYGNSFTAVSVPGNQYDATLTAVGAIDTTDSFVSSRRESTVWSVGLQRPHFSNLLELDLRACNISALDERIFENMPRLKALYLGENIIHTISGNAFMGLGNLLHLDLSNNQPSENNGNARKLGIENSLAFSKLKKLKSLDFSNSKLSMEIHGSFQNLGSSLERLSLCYTGLSRLPPKTFSQTSLRILDISGNRGILTGDDVLYGIEDTLNVLYANEIGLSTVDVFVNFTQLEMLEVTNNEISTVQRRVIESLKNLQVLDFRRNRLTAWFTDMFSFAAKLQVLDLRNNMINIISDNMMNDFARISFIGLTGNPIVCNCNARDFIEIAARNEGILEEIYLEPEIAPSLGTAPFVFYVGFGDINFRIESRVITPRLCTEPEENCYKHLLPKNSTFRLLDFDKHGYSCTKVGNGNNKVRFPHLEGCQKPEVQRESEQKLKRGRLHLLVLLVIPGVLLPLVMMAFAFRRHLKYFFLTMRNSAVMSAPSKNKPAIEESNFNYDVFVSYCNEDRPWVLDQLLTHLETDSSISLCLHERDFQVGLSILENIVSCMDRSKTIMLVISQQFLLSQWCQFELHLAQHRLLETRREDLILVLLEEIPRRLRPNTLHYLMLTKTYIVWPKTKSEEHIFWKRLKKSVDMHRLKPDTVTLV